MTETWSCEHGLADIRDCDFCRCGTPLPSGTYAIGEATYALVDDPDSEILRVWPAGLLMARQVATLPLTGSVVDVGCGCGIVGLTALAKGCRVTFMDSNPRALELAARNAIAAGFTNFDTLLLSWHSVVERQWDNVLTSETLWHGEQAGQEALRAWIHRHWNKTGVCLLGYSARVLFPGNPVEHAPHTVLSETILGVTYKTVLYDLSREEKERPPRRWPEAPAINVKQSTHSAEWPLTIGMATYDDFDGVYFTLQALRAYHPHVPVLVIETTPKRSQRVEAVTLSIGGKYLHRPDLTGTAAPRSALFSLAETPWVCCVDSHVLFEPGAVQAMLEWCVAHPESRDLVQGPLVADDGRLKLSHWRREGNSALWGTWDTDPRVHGTEPFEIEMQGLGQFLMRRAAWPEFHPLHRGFGGEEGYLHEKVRQRGGRTLCHPAMGWRHRFRDPTAAVPYPASLADHTWNLLVEHRELGIEAEQKIFEHFGKRLPTANWESLVRESREKQPLTLHESKPLKILGVWYSNNAAPEKLLQDSLGCIETALRCTHGFDVRIVTSSWDPIPGNVLPWIQAQDRNAGHGNIIRQIRQAVAKVGEWSWDAVCFLEHDVLYPADYFERVGAAFVARPDVNVVSNLDYEGLNATGWLAVKERHEPMHQLSMRRLFALANLDRAEEDCARQGWAYLEPQGDRSDWLRLPATGKSPSIHVNHAKRFTSHGEVCYEPESSRTHLPVWGDFRKWWPASEADFPCIHRGDVLRQVGCGCAGRDQRMNVHACRVYGECTIHATGKVVRQAGGADRIRACVACEERKA